ncbi:MAG: aminodeoxychorismate synthase component I [Candidatus Saccharibacteria bacterium]
MKTELVARGFIDPWQVYLNLPSTDTSFILDSSQQDAYLARYSFIGCLPKRMIRVKDTLVEVREASGAWRAIEEEPLRVIETWLREPLEVGDCPFPFAGGMVGYIGYDFPAGTTSRANKANNDLGTYDLYMGLYNWFLVFDHQENELWLVSIDGSDPSADELQKLISEGTLPGVFKCGVIQSNFSSEDYLIAVQAAKEYIRFGDIYQMNLSQRLSFDIEGDPRRLYEVMRGISPSHFGAYLNFPEYSVASTSPELFLRVRDRTIETRPIKGTRPRGKDPANDTSLYEELRNSEKDRAELLMIVDLMRNDLGRICKTCSIKVDELFSVRTYPTVHHLDSVIRGQLRHGITAEDIINATFPGGSITGAPKRKAMEIIDNLEPTIRGIYTGSLGYFSYNGNIDLNIIIRTLVVKDGRGYYQTGGGITSDSDPQAELEETWHKARVLVQAIKEVGSNDSMA